MPHIDIRWNWNEKRKEFNQIDNFAKSLAEDLEEDIEMIKIIDYTAKQIALRITPYVLKRSLILLKQEQDKIK